jgi:hypothetical protein
MDQSGLVGDGRKVATFEGGCRDGWVSRAHIVEEAGNFTPHGIVVRYVPAQEPGDLRFVESH